MNVTDADFSPDGRRLVTASADHTVRFWDLGTGQEISEAHRLPACHDGPFRFRRPPIDRRLDGPDDPRLGCHAADGVAEGDGHAVGVPRSVLGQG